MESVTNLHLREGPPKSNVEGPISTTTPYQKKNTNDQRDLLKDYNETITIPKKKKNRLEIGTRPSSPFLFKWNIPLVTTSESASVCPTEWSRTGPLGESSPGTIRCGLEPGYLSTLVLLPLSFSTRPSSFGSRVIDTNSEIYVDRTSSEDLKTSGV